MWNADAFPDCKVHGANMGPIWDRQDPSGPHIGPINFAICVLCFFTPIKHVNGLMPSGIGPVTEPLESVKTTSM